MNDEQRAALVEELAEAIHVDAARRRVFTAETAAESCLPIIDRLLAAADAPEPRLDELLNSIYPWAYVSEIAKNPGLTTEKGWQVVVSTSEALHFGIGEDVEAAIRAAVAQAANT